MGILSTTASTAASKLPDWASNPADADMKALAGPTTAATTYKPSEDALASTQLERLLKKGSSYLDVARTRATQQAAKRGLLNSSIAAGAGEKAAIESAQPFALQDARTMGEAEKYNAEATNEFARDANQFAYDSGRDKFKGVLDIAAREDEQGFKTGEREAGQEYLTSERLGEQGFKTEERLGDEGFKAGESVKEREFDAGENTKTREQQTSERLGTEKFDMARDAEQFKNDLVRISAQADANIRAYDAQNGTKLFDSYQTASQGTYDEFADQVTKVQQSDNDAEVKTKMIEDLKQLYQTRQVMINTMYSNAPKWKEEWSQFDIDFKLATGG